MTKHQIQTCDFCNMSVEDLGFVLANIKSLMSQYGHDELAGLGAPEWLTEARRAASHEFNEKTREERLATLKKMKMQRYDLLPKVEKLADLDRQIAEMEKQA